MTVLIGLHGRMGAGKDTTFEAVHNWASARGVRAARRGFADALKLSFARLFLPDCSVQEAVNWCDGLKNDTQAVLKIRWGMKDEHGTTSTIQHQINCRQALQRYGTEGHRDVFGEDFWVDALLPRGVAVSASQFEYKVHESVEPIEEPAWPANFIGPMDFNGEPPEFAVVTDVRFESEARRIKELGGDVYEVVRPELGHSGGHASEMRLPDELIDYTLRNDTTIEDLHVRIYNFMENVYAR